MIKFHPVHRPVLLRLAAGGCLITMLTFTHVARAQQGELPEPLAEPVASQVEDPAVPPMSEEMIRKELEKLKDLEITQRKAKARELIAKYPNTETARLVERYLQELELYGKAALAQRAASEARAIRVREFWRQRFAAELATIPNYRLLPLVRITNRADQAVLFQLRGYGMDWTRPRFLEVGESNEVNYPVEYRRITTEGIVTYSLQPGNEYVFNQSAAGALPRLFQVPAQK